MNNFYYFLRRLLIFVAIAILISKIPLGGIKKHIKSFKTKFINTKQINNFFSKNEVIVNVFIHGSFGSTFGILSLPKVLEDKISGTSYRDANRRLRNDDFFFTEQPILERGLIQIQPSFDLFETQRKKYAAYPIIKAFDVIDESVNKKRSKTYYYTFGWTGLISQNSRRYEAIRLYNALEDEVENFKKKGLNPKIRLITHSHGGNLCLNLAAIHKILQIKSFDKNNFISKNKDISAKDTNNSLLAMLDIMQKLPSKKNNRFKNNQKRWDYIPEIGNLEIEALILFGTPIQPETQEFCLSPIFKNVFNFYSKQDFVQRFDWISTKRYFSSQRLEKKELINKKNQYSENKKIIQAQINIGKKWNKYSEKTNSKLQEKNNEKNVPWWRQLFFIKKEEGRFSDDPTHKELWFLSWSESMQEESILGPLPVVILTPLFLHILKSIEYYDDIDINVIKSPDSIKVQVANHNQSFVLGEQKLQRQIIETMKTCVKEWKVGEKNPQEEFYAAYKHLTN